MKKLQTVIQEDGEGCWLAAAAMLTGIDYRVLREGFKFHSKVTGRSAGPLKDLLEKHNVVVEDKSTKISSEVALDDLDTHALVYGKVYFRGKRGRFKIEEKPPGHWMVWDGKAKVLRDPAKHDGEMIVEVRNFRRVLESPFS